MTDRVLAPAVEEQVRRLAPADILVAVMDPDQGAALPRAILAAEVGLAKDFSGLRPVLLTVGPDDGDSPPVSVTTTPTGDVERVLFASPSNPLRRVDLRVPKEDGASAMRRILEVADLLHVRALTLLDGDLRWVLPEWIELLAGPVVAGRFDLVTPVATRHRYDDLVGPLLAAPVTRALYGQRIRQPTGGSVALGSALIDRLLADADGGSGARDPGVWLTTVALTTGQRVGEARLGVAAGRPGTSDAAIAMRVRDVTRSILTLATRHADAWMPVRGSEEVPAYGFERLAEAPAVRVDPVRWLDAFEAAAGDRRETWSAVLSPGTRNAVLGLAVTAAGVGLSARDWLNLDRGADIGRLDTATLAGAMATFQFPDDTWARAVGDTIVAAGMGERSADDLADALVPIFLARAASFVVEGRRAGPADVEAQVERQAQAFERLKPDLVARWRPRSATVPGGAADRVMSAPRSTGT